MHYCAFWLLLKFNTRYNVNLMFAKLLFSEICTQKAHFAQLGSIRRDGMCCILKTPAGISKAAGIIAGMKRISL